MVKTSITPYVAEVKLKEGIEVDVKGGLVVFKGPLGSVTKDFSKHHVEIKKNEVLTVLSKLKGRRGRTIVGTIAAHLENLMKGVERGYRYELKVIYSHFPISIRVDKDKVIIENFRGEKRKRIAKVLEGVKVEVKENTIIVSGIDLEAVSQTAANIELATKFRGYDPRVFMDGVYIYRREEGLA